MYDYVCPEKLMNALEWLKANNPLYADVDVNRHWVIESQANDGDLFPSLVRLPETNGDNCVSDNTPQYHTHEQSTSHSDTMECETRLTCLTSESSFVKPCVHSRLSDGHDELITASITLKALATDKGFTVHDQWCIQDWGCLIVCAQSAQNVLRPRPL